MGPWTLFFFYLVILERKREKFLHWNIFLILIYLFKFLSFWVLEYSRKKGEWAETVLIDMWTPFIIVLWRHGEREREREKESKSNIQYFLFHKKRRKREKCLIDWFFFFSLIFPLVFFEIGGVIGRGEGYEGEMLVYFFGSNPLKL